MQQQQDPDSKKKIIKISVAAAVFLTAAIIAWRNLASESLADMSSIRSNMCNACSATFDYTPKEGDREPVECPKCGQMAGYSAETCYWTKDANGEWIAKLEPTYVILKLRLDPNGGEPTFCPDCGKEVVGHNPPPPEELMEAARTAAGQ